MIPQRRGVFILEAGQEARLHNTRQRNWVFLRPSAKRMKVRSLM